jgi:hypothetical protein
VPSNIFLKRLRPSLWLSGLMLLWGIIMVRDAIVSLGLDTESQWLYARLCKVWCTIMVVFLVRARLSDYPSSGYSHSTDSHSLDARHDGIRSVPGHYLLTLLVHIPLPFWFSHPHSTPLMCSPLSTAGTSAPSTAFVLPSFFPLFPYPARSAVCSQ